MKIKNAIKITTESYEEQQFILKRFPTAWWVEPEGLLDGKLITVFYVDSRYTNEATEALREWTKAVKEWEEKNRE